MANSNKLGRGEIKNKNSSSFLEGKWPFVRPDGQTDGYTQTGGHTKRQADRDRKVENTETMQTSSQT